MNSGNIKVVAAMILAVLSALLLSVNIANADSPLNVGLGLPSSVDRGVPFSISIIVTNKTNTSVTFSKVAVGYLLQDLKVKGPFEVDTSQHTVPAFGTISFNVSFTINYSPGAIVPVTVVLAQNSYDKDSIIGAGMAGVKVK
jgi:hypothetical protein